MEDLEKQMEEAAFDYARNPNNEFQYNSKMFNSFIVGAKSEAAKNFWQQGLYTEEEVYKLCKISFEMYMSSDSLSDDELYEEWEKWYNRNKKK